MPIIVSAAKGGAGATVVSAAIADAPPTPRMLVDLAGDVPAAFGIPDPSGPGALDWLASNAPVARLEELLVEIDGPPILPRGAVDRTEEPRSISDDRVDEFLAWLRRHEQTAGVATVVDAGSHAPSFIASDTPTFDLVVTRSCYLSLRAARQRPRPDGIVVIDEPGRALRSRDVERALGAPVLAAVPWDPEIARAIDAGLHTASLPRSFRRQISRLVPVVEHASAARPIAA